MADDTSYYKKPGPRLLDSKGTGPLSDIPAYIQGDTPFAQDVRSVAGAIGGGISRAASAVGNFVSDQLQGAGQVAGDQSAMTLGVGKDIGDTSRWYFTGNKSPGLLDAREPATPTPQPALNPAPPTSPPRTSSPQTPTSPASVFSPNATPPPALASSSSAPTTSNTAGYIEDASGNRSNIARSPAALGIPPRGIDVAAMDKELDKMISFYMTPQYNSRGDLLTGLMKVNAGIAGELMKTKAAGAYGLAGHEITAEATKAGHKAQAEANLDWRTANLEQRKAESKIHENQYNLMLEDKRNAASQKALQTLLESNVVHEKDPMTGATAPNMKLTYFNMFESGMDVPKELQGSVGKVGAEFENFYKRGLKGKPDAATRAKAKQEWMKRQSLYGMQ